MSTTSEQLSPELKLKMSAFGIQDGKLFFRDFGEFSSEPRMGVIGVVEVPSGLTTEKIYPTRLDEKFSQFTVESSPRDVESKFFKVDTLRKSEVADLLLDPVFKVYAEPNMMDLFFRDTEIPPTREGYKWVIACGASGAHPYGSRMVEFENGKVSVFRGERHGVSIGSILTSPEWGNSKKQHALLSSIHIEEFPGFIAESNARINNSRFKEVVRLIEAEMPTKTCYTIEEMKQLSRLNHEAMMKVMRMDFPAEGSANKPKSRM